MDLIFRLPVLIFSAIILDLSVSRKGNIEGLDKEGFRSTKTWGLPRAECQGSLEGSVGQGIGSESGLEPQP
eukprot:1150557-Amorphochlora_amoeboformis.AAC.1